MFVLKITAKGGADMPGNPPAGEYETYFDAADALDDWLDDMSASTDELSESYSFRNWAILNLKYEHVGYARITNTSVSEPSHLWYVKS